MSGRARVGRTRGGRADGVESEWQQVRRKKKSNDYSIDEKPTQRLRWSYSGQIICSSGPWPTPPPPPPPHPCNLPPPPPHPHNLPPPPPVTQNPTTNTIDEIRFISSKEDRSIAMTTMIGESESFESLMNVKAFKEVEGNSSIEIRYVGGLNSLLEFEDEVTMRKFLEEGEHIWKPWFKTLVPWKLHQQFTKRIASVIIYGVPPHAWCEVAFSTIAKNWGEILVPEPCDTENLNMAFGRTTILTDHPGLISSSLTVRIDDIPYTITEEDATNSDDELQDDALLDMTPEPAANPDDEASEDHVGEAKGQEQVSRGILESGWNYEETRHSPADVACELGQAQLGQHAYIESLGQASNGL
ncbi:hypothetical protein L2E82_27508 [Cichorium intybus]|uniref:Uncharacterized protein n=1 Tax=Cichorium intybus TaxID=13427 RepID=A0ACB9CT44_CICIN|nr:hypothetical protein L2E82_27508 [Cichorium intybus]